MSYRIQLSSPARRAIHGLPESVATAVLEFLAGPVADNPHRVGKALGQRFIGRHSARRGAYRVIYSIDEKANTVTVLAIRHRRDAYRP